MQTCKYYKLKKVTPILLLFGVLFLAATLSAQEYRTEEQEDFLYAEQLFNNGLYDLAALQFQAYADKI